MNLNDSATWDTPLFPMSVVAVAAKTPANTLRSWFQRGHVTLQSADAKAADNGLPHLFTLRSVLALAATAELVRLGQSPASAYEAAGSWIYGEHEEAGRTCESASLFRSPGKGEVDFYTLMVTSPYGLNVRLLPVPVGGTLSLYDLLGTGRIGARLVWLDYIDKHVRGVCEGFLRS